MNLEWIQDKFQRSHTESKYQQIDEHTECQKNKRVGNFMADFIVLGKIQEKGMVCYFRMNQLDTQDQDKIQGSNRAMNVANQANIKQISKAMRNTHQFSVRIHVTEVNLRTVTWSSCHGRFGLQTVVVALSRKVPVNKTKVE